MSLFLDAIAWLFAAEQHSGPNAVLVRLGEHLLYTAIALLISAVIAIPIGYAIGHTGRGKQVAVALSGAARALPSLGLLTILTLLVGVGHAEVAASVVFVVLGVPAVLAGAYAGVESVDPDVVDAARAMGMTEWQILLRVEAPIGLGLLLGGLRSATLQIVATAVLAAYVGLGGLGLYIERGIALRTYAEMLGGALVIVLLALALDGLFALGTGLVTRERRGAARRCRRARRSVRFAFLLPRCPDGRKLLSTSTRRSAGAALLAGLSLALVSACGSGDPLAAPSEEGESGGTVVVGSQAYYSNAIIAEIYAQTLENAGYTVQRQFQIGQRDAYLQAMESGEVDLLPEYSGNLLQFYAPDTTARSPEEVAGALPEVLPDGLSILDYAEAQDADSYNVTAEFSKKNDITSLADLADYDGTITIGGNAELKSRPYGLQGLKEFYDVDADFVA